MGGGNLPQKEADSEMDYLRRISPRAVAAWLAISIAITFLAGFSIWSR